MNISDELKRMIIVDNAKSPEYKVKKIDDDYQTRMSVHFNSCNDFFNVGLKIENDNLVGAQFSGEGCAISTSSLNMILKRAMNMPCTEALVLLNKYIKMIKFGTPYPELGELNIFVDVNKQLNRIDCALIGAKTIEEVLHEKKC